MAVRRIPSGVVPFCFLLVLYVTTTMIRMTNAFRTSHGAQSFATTSVHQRRTRFILPTCTLWHERQRHLHPQSYPALSHHRLYPNPERHLLPVHQRQQTVLFATKTAGKERTDRPFHLVIVESPSKCSTIEKILKEYVKDNNLDYDFRVMSSMGHIRDLPKSAAAAAARSSRRKKTDSPTIEKSTKPKIAGVDIDNGFEPTYIIQPDKEHIVNSLRQAAKEASHIVLATDQDREGEAIAWHLTQVLPDNVPFSRVTFTEITAKAIRTAIEIPQDGLDMHLVEASETRRVLDRVAGFAMSPVLFQKIAPGLSAGRVQSVGMALVVERERERLRFVSAEYWGMNAILEGNIAAKLLQVNGQPIATTGSDFDNKGTLVEQHKRQLEETDVNDLIGILESSTTWTVSSIKSKRRTIQPPLPFITSTLQQEASQRLGLSVSQTMRCAQKLYEAGQISYMRTDSTDMSEDAHAAAAKSIQNQFGDGVAAPPRSRKKPKKKKATNVEEAHEAIRPAIRDDGTFVTELSDVGQQLDPMARKLHAMIVARTLASRMPPQIVNATSVDVCARSSDDGETNAVFRVTGAVVVDPGYTAVPGISKSKDVILPTWSEGQQLQCMDLSGVHHATQPPPRYTEASFVKQLEALGIGRPSTYTRVVEVLKKRAYAGTPVKADGYARNNRYKQPLSGTAISAHRAAGGEEFTDGGKGPLVPSLTAFVVCDLLTEHCSIFVDPAFTADMEEQLDLIAKGEDGYGRAQVLSDFYDGDNGLASKVIHILENVGDEARRVHLPALQAAKETTNDGNSNDDKQDETQQEQELKLLVGPYGPYLQWQKPDGTMVSAPLPSGMAADTTTITPQTLEAIAKSSDTNGIVLGNHPVDGREIRLRLGRYGAFLQCAVLHDNDDDSDDDDKDNETVTNHSLPKHIGSMRTLDTEALLSGDATLDEIVGLTFEEAVGYVDLPRTVTHLNDIPILARLGRYGPYLTYNTTSVVLPKEHSDVLTIDGPTAERLVVERMEKGSCE